MNSLNYIKVDNRIVSKATVPPDEQESFSVNEIDEILRKASLTEWFMNPKQGQPRYVDIYRLRSYGRSEWVAAIKTYLQNRINVIPYEIVARNPKKRENPSVDIQDEIRKAEKFFDTCTPNGKSYKREIETAFLQDILELDAGIIAKQFTTDSYSGDPKQGGRLKVIGKRKLAELVTVDGGSFLKDVSVNYIIKGYWQYSYNRPMAEPVYFEPDEICYAMRYPRSWAAYGWAPTQNADAIINSLINSAVWNSNFFSNDAVPKGMITIDGDDSAVKRFRAYWQQKIKGRWFTIPVVNREAKWVPFSMSAADMEWLSGQKWYQRMMCALFQVHPSEIGVEDTSRQAGEAATTRDMLQKRSSVVPILFLIENSFNADIMPELSPRIIFKYNPIDSDEAENQAKMENEQIANGIRTINQIRIERGEQPVPWGNLPPDLLNNLIRSFSRLNVMPDIATLDSLDFSKIVIPKPQPKPFGNS